jgi:hypothetical protein
LCEESGDGRVALVPKENYGHLFIREVGVQGGVPLGSAAVSDEGLPVQKTIRTRWRLQRGGFDACPRGSAGRPAA